MFQLRKLIRSLQYATRGLILVFKEEQNFRIQIGVAAICLILAFIFPLRNLERIALILVMVFVLVLELINSIFERFVDILKPRVHFYVEVVKDVMAAAVLLASLSALIIGLIIFLPHFAAFLK